MALSKLSCKAESVMESMRNRRSEGWPVVAMFFLIAFTFAAQGCGDSGTSSSTGDAGGPSTSSTGGGGDSTTTSSSSGGDGGGGATTTSSSGGGGNTTTTSGGGGEGGGTTTSSGGNGGAGGSGSGGSTTSSTGGGGSGGGCNANETDCNGTCVSNDDPAYGCGSCTACGAVPNALVGCAGFGQCTYTCDVDRDDCDGQGFNGCEVDLNTDNANCGFCANDCSISEGNGSTCDGTGTCTPAFQDFSCTGWARDASFDAEKIGGIDIQVVGGIWGTSGSNFYVSAGTYSMPTALHWIGASWVQETLPGSALRSYGIWGVSDNDVWLTGKTNSVAMLWHRTGGMWTDDPNKPSAKAFEGVWGANSNDVFIIGWKTAGYRVWRKSGASWIEQSLPVIPTPYSYKFTSVWGFDTNNVFVTGYTTDSGSNSVNGFLLRFNGVSWSLVGSLPATAMELRAIHGTSTNDAFVTGRKSSGEGVVYHVTNNFGTWDEYADPSVDYYNPVWSKYPGAVIAGGVVPPGNSGTMRTTIDSMMSPPATSPIDGLATDAVQFWPEPGTDTVHFVHFGSPDLQLAGHYVGTCN